MAKVSKLEIDKVNKLVEKYDTLKKDNKLDLSSDEDLTVAIMNLINIEEHLFFSGAKTGESKYYTILDEIRKMRKELMLKIIPEYQGEVWCISKHLLGSSYRLMEYGTKKLAQGETKEAEDCFAKAYGLYSLFWGLNMGLIDSEGVKEDLES
ncbi:MAG TPA: hypothetical protein PKJ86_01400 [Candidatus Dojkabacteria bacterium]|nr:hypothetical protein [Candidatus Dojkabacteria bacterium]HQG57768.1 hypothetical protein [Candidatus Dojkabacteria bacterium]